MLHCAMQKELTVLVPVYNEAPTIGAVMKAITKALPESQIIYIDDGSHDASLHILRAHARGQDLVLTKENGGKGSAIRMGLEHAEGTYTVIQDADLEYEPREILSLLKTAKEHPLSAVFGSRFLTPNPNIYRRYLLGNKVVTAVLNILFGSKLTDSYTCFKLLPTHLFRSLKLRSRGFELEAEICSKCLRHRIQIIERPVHYHPRTIAEGKKIGWRDAVKAVTTMLRIRFS
jgi:dolichol-phosphate mannosyltransferase